METIKPVGDTSGKSCSNDIRESENRQGLLTDLSPSNSNPPRVAAVAHQARQSPKRDVYAMRPVMPDGNGANDGQTLLRQEDPLRYSGLEHMRQTLNTGVYEQFGCLPSPPSYRHTIDTVIAPNSLAQEDPPMGESSGSAWTSGQTGAPLPGGVLETPSFQAITASGGQHADLLDMVAQRLLFDDDEAYDPEDPNVRALMTDYEATFLDPGAAPLTSPTQGHPSVGGNSGPAPTTRPIDATLLCGTPEAPSARAIMASGGQHVDLLDTVAHRLLSDSDEGYDPEDPSVRALMADYEAMFLDTVSAPSGQAGMASGGERAKRPAEPLADPDHARAKKHARGDYMLLTDDQRQAMLHIFKTDPKRSNRSLADEFRVSYSTIKRLRKKFSTTGNLKPGTSANRLTADQRQALLHAFKTDPQRSNQSLMDEFDVSITTIKILRERFGKTGDIKPGDLAKRLTGEQRRAILHIFETDPQRSNQSIADEFGVTRITIKIIRERFGETGDIKPGDRAKRLTGDQRRAILHIFETDPQRSSQRIADEFGVTLKTILLLRERFSITGDLKPGDRAKHLTGEQRRAILHIFETDPQRSSQHIADEFGVTYKTILLLRERFSKTGDIKPGDRAKRLTGDQRRAILHIFETAPERKLQSIANEFCITRSTLQVLKNRFSRTGDIKAGDHANRLTAEQRRAILHIFEADPERSNQSLVDEFGISLTTIKMLRDRFSKTGDIKAGDHANRLSADQRQALTHIFDVDPERNNESLADEFGVTRKTIRVLRKKFSKTGNITPGNRANHLAAD